MTKKVDIKFWLIGLAMFGALIAFDLLAMADRPFSIIDHQAAGTAERVNEIQLAWKDAGYFTMSTISMVGDLIFIVFYSLGAWRAGTSIRAHSGTVMRFIGLILMVAAPVFFVTDIVETSLQLTQMLMDQGVDWMAATAAFMQPIKINAWIVSFVAVIAALIAARFSSSAA